MINKLNIFMFLVWLVLIDGSITCNARTKLHVQMINILQGKNDLQIHCKSKNDDLGVHIIPFNGNYGFEFTPNFFAETLYFCGFKWDENLHWFDIYVHSRDRFCTNVCTWNISESGPCYIFDDKSTKCYGWNN